MSPAGTSHDEFPRSSLTNALNLTPDGPRKRCATKSHSQAKAIPIRLFVAREGDDSMSSDSTNKASMQSDNDTTKRVSGPSDVSAAKTSLFAQFNENVNNSKKSYMESKKKSKGGTPRGPKNPSLRPVQIADGSGGTHMPQGSVYMSGFVSPPRLTVSGASEVQKTRAQSKASPTVQYPLPRRCLNRSYL